MEGILELRRRIRGVREIRNITRAMKMVAATKLKRAQERLESARPFAQKIDEMLVDILSTSERTEEDGPIHPLMASRPVHRAVLILISSDRGLAGAYNANLIHQTQAYMKNHPEQPEFKVIVVGRKGRDYLRRLHIPIMAEFTDVEEFVSYKRAQEIAALVMPSFIDGSIDEVSIVYSNFHSAQRQSPTVYRLLPITVPKKDADDQVKKEWLFEPNAEAVLDQLIPRFIHAEIYRTLLEGYAGETGARMTSMSAATDNADNIITDLSLVYNRSRQSLITREITELMGGVEALN
jgi:F-type H+-transporting ATPase subunit gamma